ALAFVGEKLRSLREPKPAHFGDLVTVFWRDGAEPAAAVADEVEADDLEHALARPRIDVANVPELADEAASGAGLLGDLAQSGFIATLAGPDQTLGECPDPRRLPGGPDRGELPFAGQAPPQNRSGREFAAHARACDSLA